MTETFHQNVIELGLVQKRMKLHDALGRRMRTLKALKAEIDRDHEATRKSQYLDGDHLPGPARPKEGEEIFELELLKADVDNAFAAGQKLLDQAKKGNTAVGIEPEAVGKFLEESQGIVESYLFKAMASVRYRLESFCTDARSRVGDVVSPDSEKDDIDQGSAVDKPWETAERLLAEFGRKERTRGSLLQMPLSDIETFVDQGGELLERIERLSHTPESSS